MTSWGIIRDLELAKILALLARAEALSLDNSLQYMSLKERYRELDPQKKSYEIDRWYFDADALLNKEGRDDK